MFVGELVKIGIMLAGAGACIFVLDWIDRTFTRICEEEAAPGEFRGGKGEGPSTANTQTPETHVHSRFTARFLLSGEA